MAGTAFGYSWSEGEKIPAEGLPNPYKISDLQSVRRDGLLHSLYYPVEVTGSLLPLSAIKNFVEADSRNILRKIVEELFQGFTRIDSMDDVQAWLGLNEYPKQEGEGAYFVPFRDGKRPQYRMGFTDVQLTGRTLKPVSVFTMSCTACHSANLFGRQIIGLTNRFPRAGHAFVNGVKFTKKVNSVTFALGTGSANEERLIYEFTRQNLHAVEPVMPLHFGLDASLAHTALALSKRAADPDASKSYYFENNPRPDRLRQVPGDSKPAVWWNVKYKNKWLLDGSVVSGNPIFTNILWNEIGRGTDLVELRDWLARNRKIVEELTTAVYSSEPPHITDYMRAEDFDIVSAQRGEKLFQARCQKCHGEYVKGWSNPAVTAQVSQLKTEKVIYFEDTPIRDVGTDPLRREAMSSLVQLNNLRISQENGIKVKVQKGYVPPPLVGIWARYPYFHNNSAPTLCAVLTAHAQRPKAYWARPADDFNKDFDRDCNGYPRAAKPGLGREFLFTSDRPGLSNKGHDARIFIEDGREIFSPADKRDLIRFLQTL